MKQANTTDEVSKRMTGGISYAQAVTAFRDEFYQNCDLKVINNPEIAYDTKSDRYVLKMVVGMTSTKQSFKTTGAVAKAIAPFLGKVSTYFGFQLNSEGIVDDFVVERFE